MSLHDSLARKDKGERELWNKSEVSGISNFVSRDAFLKTQMEWERRGRWRCVF